MTRSGMATASSGVFHQTYLLAKGFKASGFAGIIVKPSEALNAYRAEIRRIVESNHACNARVFGSVIDGDDTEHSDLDLLVDATPDTSLMDNARIQNSGARLKIAQIYNLLHWSPRRQRTIPNGKWKLENASSGSEIYVR